MSPPPEREQRFRLLYEDIRPHLLGFLRRRAGPEVAEDLVADTLLVVWRRLDEAPTAHEDARAWAFGIARHLLLNHRRGLGRRDALAVRLQTEREVARQTPGEVEGVVDRVDLARAWRLLSARHQEVLALAVVEDLDASRTAVVLGISPVAVRLRLSRARRALRAHLCHRPPPAPATASVAAPAVAPTVLRSTR
ncbi:RNA polymerase sigma factor [Pseudokineococcus sp. 1T1Z-3]|uniref:RNA polymerase sigma factor n=1 Tax=Pseudokineococcus sp. 1T1Z-3 TaxID=3132745 RepID=UPI0030B2FE58